MQIAIGIIGLAIIVFIHELGHFLAAKYYKVQVEEFAIGMGPKLLSRAWGGTVYSLRLLPLGGFCRMKSEHEAGFDYKKAHADAVIPPTEGTLFMLPIFKKAVVLLAGPGANVAWYVLMSLLLFATGYETEVLTPRIDPVENRAAYEAGLQSGDTITRLDGVEIDSFSQLAEAARKRAGKTVRVEYVREGTPYAQDMALGDAAPVLGVYPFVTPVVTPVRESRGSFVQVFKPHDIIRAVGDVEIQNAAYLYSVLKKHRGSSVTVVVQRGEETIKLPVFVSHADPMRAWGITFPTEYVKRWSSFGQFISTSIEQAITMTTSTLRIIIALFTFQKTDETEDVAGPIRIISVVGGNTLLVAQTRGLGYALWQFINISAVLSFAIALMNLIPIPVLDGGQLAFYTFHALRRKAPKYKSLVRFQSIGVVIMLFLFVLIMFKDISAIMQTFR